MPPLQGVSHGESFSAPSALGISPPPVGPMHLPGGRWGGRAEGDVGRAVNHLCFPLISRATTDQSAAS